MQTKQQRNKLLKQLQTRLDEIKGTGKSVIVGQNLRKLKKMKKTKEVPRITQPPKEKKLEEIKEGKIKWWDSRLGYGFIAGNDGVDYFLHHTELKSADFTTPTGGEAVLFKGEKSEKGMKAIKVSKQ